MNKINSDGFEKVASLPCGGHPVSADIYENDDKLEAWVCSYSSGSISIYTLKKNSKISPEDGKSERKYPIKYTSF